MNTEQTSIEAKQSIQGHPSQTLRGKVFGYLYTQGAKGATCDEIELKTKMKHQTASARIRELRDDDMIHDSGFRRATRSGRKAIVYVVSL